MRERFSMLTIIAAAGAFVTGSINPTAAQAPASPGTASAPGVDYIMGRTRSAGHLDR
jgi:hypothetical protein